MEKRPPSYHNLWPQGTTLKFVRCVLRIVFHLDYGYFWYNSNEVAYLVSQLSDWQQKISTGRRVAHGRGINMAKCWSQSLTAEENSFFLCEMSGLNWLISEGPANSKM